jgi:lipopolysaccharide biosynthesis glycosyltransferase
MKVVTAIDEKYYPGLVALNNSIKTNSPNHELICIVYGDDSLVSKVRAQGIQVIDNPVMDVELAVSQNWPIASKAMYARLLIPELFKDNRIIWLDADCIVLKPLDALETLTFTEPVAAVWTSAKYLNQQINGLKSSHNIRALFAGLLIFNSEEWRRRDITNQCFEAMKESLEFKYVVQSVLSYVLQGDFHEIGHEWQIFANRPETDAGIIENANILHYVGALPWKAPMRNQTIWEQYA